MTFAERLRLLRLQTGLSEARLAQLSGVSFGAVHNYGLGIRKPTFAAVVKLARALGVSCEDFADCADVAEDPVPADPLPRRPRPPRRSAGRRRTNLTPAKDPPPRKKPRKK